MHNALLAAVEQGKAVRSFLETLECNAASSEHLRAGREALQQLAHLASAAETHPHRAETISRHALAQLEVLDDMLALGIWECAARCRRLADRFAALEEFTETSPLTGEPAARAAKLLAAELEQRSGCYE